MNQAEFESLCRDTCAALGMEDVDALHRDGQIDIGDVTVAAHLIENEDPDCIYCYADLGRPGHEHRGSVFAQLLELNLLEGSPSSGIFGFDSDSGHAVACLQVRGVDTIDGEHLAEVLQLFVEGTEAARQLVANAGDADEDVALPPLEPMVAFDRP